jgi:sec-independent protein translocase protein TatC
MTAALSERPGEEPDDESTGGKMGFLDHLDELRTRIIRSLIAVAAGTLAAYLFVDRIGTFILTPVIRSLPSGETLIYTKPGEGLAFDLDIALICGLVLAAPFVMYQVWRFIAPALYAKEKRYAIPFVVLTTVGTLGGALFTHYLMFPTTIAFLGSFNSKLARFMPRVEDTFELYKNMMIGMVLVFQMPTLVFFLARMRLVTARFLWRHIKYAILIIFIMAAVLTSSTDWWNQTVFAAPMIVLYLISIGLAWLARPRHTPEPAGRAASTRLRMVFAAAVIDRAARRHVGRAPLKFPHRGVGRS